jgi:thiol-disulfide isomerase/thioredoxin
MAFLASTGKGGWEARPMNPVAAHLTNVALLLHGATGWVNSPPLTEGAVRGKVILVDFWTYTCINWRRTLPYVRAWAEKYKDHGLVVIGVHAPEFSFEKDIDNVRRETPALAILYPVAVDSDYAIWRTFHNEYWPALYLVDARGQIRYHQFGEGGYEEIERAIQHLLAEAGNVDLPRGSYPST